MLLPSGITLVEAAHIHQFSQSKNDDIQNGLALCRNHHWAFDQGLWSIDNNLSVIVAIDKFSEESPNQIGLVQYHSKKLEFSWMRSEFHPNQAHLEWHRKNKFIGNI